MRPAFIITLLFVFSACLVRAEPVIDYKSFVEQKLTVVGLAGTPWEAETSFDEERSRAWMDAMHHAYESILALPLMEGKLVRQVLQTNPALKDRLGLILLSAEKSFYQADNTGLIRCRLEVPFSGKLSLRSALYLAAMRPQSQQPVSFLASWSAGISKEKLPVPQCKRLVVDVRNYYFEPSIFPRLFDTNGALLFQEAMIPQPERFSRPAVKFAVDVVEARGGLEEGAYEYVPAHINELSRSDITVPDADAGTVAAFCLQMINHPDRELDVVIVFDPDKKEISGKMPAVKPEKKEKEGKPAAKIPDGGKK